MTEDVNGDGQTDFQDRQAEWRREDQEETARMWGGLFASVVGAISALGAALGNFPAFLRRVRIVWRVQVVGESVTDAQALYDKLFLFPPEDAGHDSYRRAFVALALERKKTREQWLMFADMLDGLERYEERPLDAWLLLRKAPSPRLTAPASAQPQAQGLLGPLPVPGLNYVTQAIAAVAVLCLLFGLWMRGDAMKAHAQLDVQRNRAETAESTNGALLNRLGAAETAMQQSRAVLSEYQTRVEAMQRKDAARAAEVAAIRRREQERAHEVASGQTANRSDDEWLKGIASAASLGGGNNGAGDGGVRQPSDAPPDNNARLPADHATANPAGLLGGVQPATGSDAGGTGLPKQ